MAYTNQRFDDGLELAPFQAVDDYERGKQPNLRRTSRQWAPATNYGGMEAHVYGGVRTLSTASVTSENELEKLPFNSRKYEGNLRSRLHRDLKTRQISMIAIGGALGTGLLINSGTYLAQSGPASMLIGYTLVGILCYAVMAALGEMAAWLPIPAGFSGFANRFVDPALGFAVGWNYWFKYVIHTPNNLIASTLVIGFWFEKTGYEGPASNAALYVAVVLVAVVAINFFGVGLFGEFEFVLSSIKVIIMLGLIFFTFSLAVTGGSMNSAPGFKYWVNPGAFAPFIATGSAGRFLGFWNVLASAVFSFDGAELVGVTIGEAQNPRRAVPRAVKLTFFRIVFFYIILIFLLGLNVPFNSPLLRSANNESGRTVTANASPFVVAARLAGVTAGPDVINAFLLVFTFSAANTDLYIATRSLYSLAVEGNAPKIFAHTSDRGVPIYSLGACSALALVAFISVDVGSFETFQYMVSLVTIFGLLTWISILLSHIYFVRARRVQVVPDTALAYLSPFGITGSFAALIFGLVILIFNGFADFTPDPVTGDRFRWRKFIVHYIGVLIFAAMYVGYKVAVKTKVWTAQQADLFEGKKKIDEDEAEFLAMERKRLEACPESKWRKWYRATLGNFF